jgi:hypothetical protein
LGFLAFLLWIMPWADSLNFFKLKLETDRNQIIADV